MTGPSSEFGSVGREASRSVGRQSRCRRGPTVPHLLARCPERVGPAPPAAPARAPAKTISSSRNACWAMAGTAVTTRRAARAAEGGLRLHPSLAQGSRAASGTRSGHGRPHPGKGRPDDMSPRRTDAVARVPTAPEQGDRLGQVSWLAGRCGVRPSQGRPMAGPSGMFEPRSPLTVAGAAPDLHRLPFTPHARGSLAPAGGRFRRRLSSAVCDGRGVATGCWPNCYTVTPT